MKIKIIALFLVCVLTLSLVACTDGNTTDETTIDDTSTDLIDITEDTSTEQEEDWDTEYPFVHTDFGGYVTEIDSEPMRIVSNLPHITEIIIALEIEDRLVGRDAIVDVDTIIALDPDIVFIYFQSFDQDQIDQLRTEGIDVIRMDLMHQADEFQDQVRLMGQILNQNEIADQIINEMQMSISNLQSQIESLDRPTVLFLGSLGDWGICFTEETLQGSIIAVAGGRNIADSIGGTFYSTEELLAEDPDIILVYDFILDEFLNTEPYSQLSAVSNGTVISVDSEWSPLIGGNGFYSVEGVERLAALFYPEVFN